MFMTVSGLGSHCKSRCTRRLELKHTCVCACVFLQAAPINAVLLWSVGLRPAALSIAEVLNHLLGDVPLPPLLGYLQQCSGDWRATMSVAAGVLGVAAALFAVALWVVREAGGEGSEVQVLPEGGAADDAARESGLVPPLLDA